MDGYGGFIKGRTPEMTTVDGGSQRQYFEPTLALDIPGDFPA